MSRCLPCCFLILLLCCEFCAIGSTKTVAQEVDFASEVWPLLEERCHGCHAGESADGQLRLDARQPFLAGGISGAAVVAPNLRTHADDLGTLLVRIASEDPDQRMPLGEEPLTAAEIRILRQWVEQGAPWPDSIGVQASIRQHWAYVAPKKAKLPQVDQVSWPRTPIDRFVLAQLESFDQKPSPVADEARLVRRLYLDLIGLPPTVEQLDDYFKQPRSTRYEHLVDQLLASPRYGERWARPWLDAARYADSNGYQADQYREVWAYRDWVINAFNQDMPFDQFTIEQLAGDLIPDATLAQRIATGFQRLTTCNVEAGVDPEENRVNQIVDRVNTTGAVWLGTTLECAQCHNHKYDPFSQQDYYSLFAYFNQTPIEVEDSGNTIQFEFVGPKMALPLSESEGAKKNELEARLAKLQQDRKTLRQKLLVGFPDWVARQQQRMSHSEAWRSFEVDSIEASQGTQFKRLDDQSFLTIEQAPDKDNYRLDVHVNEAGRLHAIRLETLTHDALPGRGPGRLAEDNPNFILNEFRMGRVDDDLSVENRNVSWRTAFADFSQNGWPITAAIDAKLDTGWGINPQIHKDHWAIFVPQVPLEVQAGDRFQIELAQRHGEARTIGRLRLTYSCVAEDALPPPSVAIQNILTKSVDERSGDEVLQLENHFLDQADEWTEHAAAIKQLQQEIKSIQPSTTLVMVEAEPRETFVLSRGDFLAPTESVTPGTPRVLPSLPDGAPDNRLALARWLVSADQPLTARVLVNRWWSEFFGRGIVATLEDFGSQGEPPTHPELLDWLAVELMEHDWSMKHIHRLIVMSAVYQQTSRSTAAQLEWDPQNKWLGRSSRFRLPAESIRDNALTIAGLLSNDMYGEPVYPPQPSGVWRHVGRNAPKYQTSTGDDRFRRGVYVIWRRSAPYPSFVNFDAPDRASCVVDRSRTNTPLQALTLLNDPAYVEITRALADELVERYRQEQDWVKLIRYAVRRSVAREPSSREIATLFELCQRERQQWIESRPNKTESTNPNEPHPADVGAIRALATVLLNLDETITRE